MTSLPNLVHDLPHNFEAEQALLVNIAKNRHGPTGTAHLRFDGPTTSFSDVPDGLPGVSQGVAADAASAFRAR